MENEENISQAIKEARQRRIILVGIRTYLMLVQEELTTNFASLLTNVEDSIDAKNILDTHFLNISITLDRTHSQSFPAYLSAVANAIYRWELDPNNLLTAIAGLLCYAVTQDFETANLYDKDALAAVERASQNVFAKIWAGRDKPCHKAIQDFWTVAKEYQCDAAWNTFQRAVIDQLAVLAKTIPASTITVTPKVDKKTVPQADSNGRHVIFRGLDHFLQAARHAIQQIPAFSGTIKEDADIRFSWLEARLALHEAMPPVAENEILGSLFLWYTKTLESFTKSSPEVVSEALLLKERILASMLEFACTLPSGHPDFSTWIAFYNTVVKKFETPVAPAPRSSYGAMTDAFNNTTHPKNAGELTEKEMIARAIAESLLLGNSHTQQKPKENHSSTSSGEELPDDELEEALRLSLASTSPKQADYEQIGSDGEMPPLEPVGTSYRKP